MMQHKKTAPDQVAFVDTFKKLILELMAYVKEWHTTGVAWNAKVRGPSTFGFRTDWGGDTDGVNVEVKVSVSRPGTPY